MTSQIESNHKNGSISVDQWTSGPDRLMPAASYISNKLDQPVKLRFSENDLKRYPPLSIYTIFKKTVDLKPDHDALAYKLTVDGPWLKFSYLEYWKMTHKVAKGFIKLGVNPNECVAIIGFNSPQWFVSLLGSIFAGYKDNSFSICLLPKLKLI
jgi:long-chain-fatty-acid--CoA ligase ACSBG